MKEENCTIIENKCINNNYFLLKLKAPYISTHSNPGNFIMIAASTTYSPLLKRPFGIFMVETPFIWIYYQVVGKGTHLLSGLKPNDPVKVIGPLGNTFPILENKKILMVAGGRGIAPLYYAMKNYAGQNKIYLIYGAKSKEDLNLTEMINQLPLEKTFLYTDDGSSGKKGYVTSDICEILRENDIEVTISCGPDAMFHQLYHTIKDMPTENYVSLEALMGCGFGICHSCVVKTNNNEYKKVCSDGPVFKMEEISWAE